MSSNDHDDGEVEHAESTAEFKPVVELPSEVQVQTGEENDEVVYKHRSKLYRFAAESKEWKERGTGDVKLLKNTTSGKVRLVMRQEKTNKLVLNHFVHPLIELKTNPGSDSTWTWSAEDFSEGCGQMDMFAIRFKTAEIAGEFKKAHEDARKANEQGKSEESTKTEETAKTEEKAEEPAAAAEPAKAE